MQNNCFSFILSKGLSTENLALNQTKSIIEVTTKYGSLIPNASLCGSWANQGHQVQFRVSELGGCL